MNENSVIADSILLLSEGKYSERKKFLKEIHEKGGTAVDGFYFNSEPFCWLVWKPTNFEIHPEYKGESLLKVVPKTVNSKNNIMAILEAQPWTYI